MEWFCEASPDIRDVAEKLCVGTTKLMELIWLLRYKGRQDGISLCHCITRNQSYTGHWNHAFDFLFVSHGYGLVGANDEAQLVN